MKQLRFIFILWFLLVVAACTGLPENVQPVKNFDADKYLGKWYEIARLDHSFERGLTNVTAQYAYTDGGTIEVINRGFASKDGEWSEAEGKAKFVTDENIGHLKVAFFWPFYGSYVVFDLDDAYQHAFVAGNNHKYLWLLARTPTVSEELKQRFIKTAKAKGFATDELIFVDQSKNIK